MDVSVNSHVWQALNAIIKNEVRPVVDNGGDTIIVLNASQIGLGNLLYTFFNRYTGVPIASYGARYGAQHTVGQVVYYPFPKRKLDYFVDTAIPDFVAPMELTPLIIPGCYISN